MNQITKETRLESYIQRPTRNDEILRALGDKRMTARQVLDVLGRHDMNEVRPRLTEMMNKGFVKVVEAYDQQTERNVALYEKA